MSQDTAQKRSEQFIDAVQAALTEGGLAVLDHPSMFFGFLADNVDDCVELRVMTRQCDEELLKPFAHAGTDPAALNDALNVAYMLLVDECAIKESYARWTAEGIALGIARWAGLDERVVVGADDANSPGENAFVGAEQNARYDRHVTPPQDGSPSWGPRATAGPKVDMRDATVSLGDPFNHAGNGAEHFDTLPPEASAGYPHDAGHASPAAGGMPKDRPNVSRGRGLLTPTHGMLALIAILVITCSLLLPTCGQGASDHVEETASSEPGEATNGTGASDSDEGGFEVKFIDTGTSASGKTKTIVTDPEGYLTLPENAYDRSGGYTFVRWSTVGMHRQSDEPSESEISGVPGDVVQVDQPTRFYAHWSRSLDFDGNGADGGSVASILLDGVGGGNDEIALPDCGYVRNGCHFAGWADNPVGVGLLQPGATLGEDEWPSDGKMYAIWEYEGPAESFLSVAYDYDGSAQLDVFNLYSWVFRIRNVSDRLVSVRLVNTGDGSVLDSESLERCDCLAPGEETVLYHTAWSAEGIPEGAVTPAAFAAPADAVGSLASAITVEESDLTADSVTYEMSNPSDRNVYLDYLDQDHTQLVCYREDGDGCTMYGRNEDVPDGVGHMLLKPGQRTSITFDKEEQRGHPTDLDLTRFRREFYPNGYALPAS